MFWLRPTSPRIDTGRLILRPPAHGDFPAWSSLRAESREFLTPWEPRWASDHLTARAFRRRVVWAGRSIRDGRSCPLFLCRKRDGALLGAVTVDNIRKGPAMAATVGYWIGEPHIRRGYMKEALTAVVGHIFAEMDLSRVEAACLPENLASRRLLEACGFKYEGVAQSYLEIGGRWRSHVLYAALRHDRRGEAPD